MKKNHSLDPSAKGQFLIYQSEDGRVKIDVRLENETVWLTQQHLAALFQTTKQNISLHLQNIFEEGELAENSVVKESLITAVDGKSYQTKLYSLDAIISVGYRVKSAVATKTEEKGREEMNAPPRASWTKASPKMLRRYWKHDSTRKDGNEGKL